MNKKDAAELNKLVKDMNDARTQLPKAAEAANSEKGWTLKSGLEVKVHRTHAAVGLGVFRAIQDPVLGVADPDRDELVATLMPRQDPISSRWDQWSLQLVEAVDEA